MRTLFLTLIISLLFVSANYAQIPKEAFPLTNSLSSLWSNGDTEKAIESSMKLYQLYPPMFISRIHNTLAQKLKRDSQLYGLNYLEQLFNKNNEEINEIIIPIFLWRKAMNATEENELKLITSELKNLLRDSSNYDSKTERYCLLIIKELDKKNAIDHKTREELLKKNISCLETYPFIEEIVADRKEGEKRAWHRYMLACSYDFLYLKMPIQEDYLKKASDYSPDINDRLHKSAYFYDAGLLTGNSKKIGYKSKYQKYLAGCNREAEALNLLCEIAFGNPSKNNIKSLKDSYANSKKNESFKSYWENHIHNKGKTVPKVNVEFEKGDLDLTKKPGNWIYIDVWGSWCKPCCRELPELQSFYTENELAKNTSLKIYTFSFHSKNLDDFMTENKYTFPVSEIDKKINDLFEVSGYPTKILITPKGNYIKIPFGADWRMFIKNYTLIN